jgi:hypothetical protein
MYNATVESDALVKLVAATKLVGMLNSGSFGIFSGPVHNKTLELEIIFQL